MSQEVRRLRTLTDRGGRLCLRAGYRCYVPVTVVTCLLASHPPVQDEMMSDSLYREMRCNIRNYVKTDHLVRSMYISTCGLKYSTWFSIAVVLVYKTRDHAAPGCGFSLIYTK